MRIKDMKLRTKVALGASAVAVSVLGGGAALAFFTGASNTASGAGSVGQSAQWGIANNNDATGVMYPGAGSTVFTVKVTNNGLGHQSLGSVVAAVDTDTTGKGDCTSPADLVGNGGAGCTPTNANYGDAKSGVTDITGCLAGWFGAAVSNLLESDGTTTATLPDDLAPSDFITGTVTVTMSDSGNNQDACQQKTPSITVTAAS